MLVDQYIGAGNSNKGGNNNVNVYKNTNIKQIYNKLSPYPAYVYSQ